MLLRLNPAFDAMANKLGTGIVAYNFSDRQFSRNYVVPANPETAPQIAVRANFGAISTAWSGLTVTEANEWDALAALIGNRTDSLGRSYPWTGKALFTSINSYRLLDAAGIETDATTITHYVPVALLDAQVWTLATGNLTLTISTGPSWTADNGAFAVLRISKPLPGDNRRARETDLRFATPFPDDSIFPITSAGTQGLDLDESDIEAFMGVDYTTADRIGHSLITLTSDYVPSTTFLAGSNPIN